MTGRDLFNLALSALLIIALGAWNWWASGAWAEGEREGP
jgi:hypothetical protein